MGIFSNFVKQLLTKKEKRSSISSSPQTSKTEANTITTTSTTSSSNTRSSSYTMSHNNSITSKPTVLSALTTKEGRNFKYNEDGRRYHGYDDIAYMMPNDDDEADRLHQQHWILRYALQCNYHAPVTKLLEEGILVLDSGCGPATWTFEMGEAFPRSRFHGVDITGVFPEAIMPANVSFVIGNIAKRIPFPDNTFDYIHQRLLIAALTNDDWESTLKELYRVLKPGGYIELGELDVHNPINMGPLFTKLQGIATIMFSTRGLSADVCSQLKNRLVKNGFVDPVLKITPLDLNHSSKAGELLWADYRHACRTAKSYVAKFNPEWEDAQVHEDYVISCGVEAKNNKISVNWYACYAQKPLESSSLSSSSSPSSPSSPSSSSSSFLLIPNNL